MDDEFTFIGLTVPKFAMASGGLLVAWGIIAYLIQSADPPSPTAAIPAFVGLPMFGLGIMGNRNQENLRHYMHAAMVVALFMALGGARIINGGMSSFAFISHLLLLLFGVAFMFVGIRSFRHARLLREAGGAE